MTATLEELLSPSQVNTFLSTHTAARPKRPEMSAPTELDARPKRSCSTCWPPSPRKRARMKTSSHVSAKSRAALERLVEIAQGDTRAEPHRGQLLLGLVEHRRVRRFDLTDVWPVDMAIAVDIPRVFALVAGCQHYPDTLGHGDRFEQIVRIAANRHGGRGSRNDMIEEMAVRITEAELARDTHAVLAKVQAGVEVS
jgi:hypothetical protein